MVSAEMVARKSGKYRPASYSSGYINGLVLYVLDTISMLQDAKRPVLEMAMDATYGTNNPGMDLFAVLAEVDGTGVTTDE